MLHPDEQFDKLGSVGRECVGSQPIRLLDADGNDVPDGEPGELYSCTPYTFDGYWKLPDKTHGGVPRRLLHASATWRGATSNGYIHLVDRKSNMIISGGENIYPSEVEAVLVRHPKVKDVAVIGLARRQVGRARPRRDRAARRRRRRARTKCSTGAASRIAGYKRPRVGPFIRDDDMPRTATGKILHRELRAMFAARASEDPASDRGRKAMGMPVNRPERRTSSRARHGSRAFSRRAASTACSACRAATSSRSGTTSRVSASASSTCATKARPCTWRTRMRNSPASSASRWSPRGRASPTASPRSPTPRWRARRCS